MRHDPPEMNVLESPSTRPYLIRALYEWCTDGGLTPYVAVLADDTVRVPREYVRGGEIVLNISADATSGLTIGNEFIEFKARFGGVPRDIVVPVDRVLAIYARETGQGMAFPLQATLADGETTSIGTRPAAGGAVIQLVPPGEGEAPPVEDPPPAPPTGGRRPALKRIK